MFIVVFLSVSLISLYLIRIFSGVTLGIASAETASLKEAAKLNRVVKTPLDRLGYRVGQLIRMVDTKVPFAVCDKQIDMITESAADTRQWLKDAEEKKTAP